MITPELAVVYIANILKLVQTNGALQAQGQGALARVCQRLPVDQSTLDDAAGMLAGGDYVMTPVGRFSDKIQNLEDMLYVGLADGELSADEKKQVRTFMEKICIAQHQIKTIFSEVKTRAEPTPVCHDCSCCGKSLAPDAKFCTECGTPLSE